MSKKPMKENENSTPWMPMTASNHPIVSMPNLSEEINH